MMFLSRVISRAAGLLAPAIVILAFGGSLSMADVSSPAAGEKCAPTGHVVGDTVARGIDFALKPVYHCLSNACFLVCKPPEPRLNTTISMQESPEQKP